MAKPFADYIISMSYGTYFCCSNITNTTEKKQMILDYVFAGRGTYVNASAMNTEVNAAVTYIQNMNVIAAYETLSTSTDASAVAQAISQAYVQGYNSRVDYGTNG